MPRMREEQHTVVHHVQSTYDAAVPKRVLWIGQAFTNGDAGDVLYDQRLSSACQTLGVTVEHQHVSAVSRVRELSALARGRPYYRARYESRANREAIVRAAAGHECAICSWEPLDSLAYSCPIPTIPILHNLTSQAARSIFPRSLLARVIAARSALFERWLYRSGRFPAIAVLSQADRRWMRRIAPEVRVVVASPGMPPIIPLSAGARVRAELIISGSFGWFPKRRDVLRFAQEYARHQTRLPVLAEQLPPRVAALLGARAPRTDDPPGISFGLISDRFTSGFKLKTTAYLAQNAVVLSYAPIPEELRTIADSALFLREVERTEDIPAHVAAVQGLDPEELRQRFEAFKQRCALRFSWQNAARTLLAAFSPERSATEGTGGEGQVYGSSSP